MILVVNNRLVEGCAPLRRALDYVYVEYAKQKPDFIYLALQLPCKCLLPIIKVTVGAEKRHVLSQMVLPEIM